MNSGNFPEKKNSNFRNKPRIDFEKFKRAKLDAEEFYKSIGEIYCPYLKEKISFNAKGLDHIKFGGWNKTRPLRDQYIRLRLLKLAPQIIRESHTLQEFFETTRLERRRINAKWQMSIEKTTYYGFVAIIRDCRIKIIIKSIEGGSKFFWSIIPFWKNRRYKVDENTVNNKKILHEGDLELQ